MSQYSLSHIDSPLLNNLSAHIAFINVEGQIVAANKAWQNFDDSGSRIKRPQKGTNYFEMLRSAVEMGNDYALKQMLGMKKVIRQKRESFVLDYPIKSTDKLHWFKLNFHPCNDNHSLFVAIHEDISSSILKQQVENEIKSRYQVQFEQSLDGILITDAQGNIIDANPAACTILGWDQKKLLSFNRSKIMDVDSPSYQQALTDRKEKGTYKLEMNLIHKNGYKIPTEIASRAYRTQRGKLRAVVSFRDISQRKNIESSLNRNRQFTESALNSIPGIFFVLKPNGDLIRWNDNMIESLGYQADELKQKSALNFVIEEHKPFVRKKIEECIEVGELSIDTQIVNKKEQIRDYHILAKRFTRNDNTFIVATGIDITEQKKTALENQKNQLMMEQLFENAPVGIAIVNTDDNIKRVNKSFENIFGYTKEEVKGQNIDHLLAPGNKLKEAQNISHAAQQGISDQNESVRLHNNGQKIPVLIGSVPVTFQDKIIAYYGIYVDISEQHNYRKKIEGTLHEKEVLLSELHHRVKNNLALISSLIELQVYESDNQRLQQELTNTKDRILTIASIHEALFQNGNLTKIPFNTFLKKLIGTAGIKEKIESKGITLNIDTQELTLGINQSIPCGLFLNEMLSLIGSCTNINDRKNIDINFREYGPNVHLILEGDKLFNNPAEIKMQGSLHNILIETLTNQLKGKLLWPLQGKDHQKIELIFAKEYKRGSANSLTTLDQ